MKLMMIMLIIVPGEAVLDRLGVIAGPPASDPDQVSEGKGDRHLGEPARTVPRQQLLELGDQLLVGPPDVEGDLERNADPYAV